MKPVPPDAEKALLSLMPDKPATIAMLVGYLGYDPDNPADIEALRAAMTMCSGKPALSPDHARTMLKGAHTLIRLMISAARGDPDAREDILHIGGELKRALGEPDDEEQAP